MSKRIASMLCFFSLIVPVFVNPSGATPPAEPLAKVVSANTAFGFKLFGKIMANNLNRNVFLSPLSVAFALALAADGAAGDTREAMVRALELDGLGKEEVNRANAALRKALLEAGGEVDLTIGNSLWARKGAPLKADYVKRAQEYYGAEVRSLDFAAPKAASVLNDWVSKATRGKIPQAFKSISSDAVAILMNAVYFKGKWAEPFKKELTKDGPFYLPDGKIRTVPMMARGGRFAYLKGEKFQAVSLPYGKGRFSLLLFLPDKSSSLPEFYRHLTGASWQQWLSQFQTKMGSVTMPRFKLRFEAKLNPVLSALGMGPAFSSKADFSGIAAHLFLSQVIHQSFVEVNEEGTEAAAVTKITLATGRPPKDKDKFTLLVDRPFFFAIRDRQTWALLFLGSVADPGK
jgi:serine protease inhibitor